MPEEMHVLCLLKPQYSDESLLDVDTAEVPDNSNETPNTFGRNLLRRLGIPHGAEAARTPPPSDNTSIEAKLTLQRIVLSH